MSATNHETRAGLFSLRSSRCEYGAGMTISGPIIVTGASTGIGAATTARLVAAGRTVITLDVKTPPPGAATHHHCDLNDPASIDATVAKLDGTYASLLNIAGVPGTLPSSVVVGVNTLGLRQLTDALFDRIADGGTIVNVSSIAGNNWKKRADPIRELLATPDFASGAEWWTEHERTVGADAYTFSKEAVVVYTMMLAGRGIARGIQVNDVGPGPVDTPIFPDFRAQVGAAQMDWLVSQTGRAAQPDDIAQVLVWLAIGEHTWLNGQHLIVDGGYTAGMSSGWVDRTTSPLTRR